VNGLPDSAGAVVFALIFLGLALFLFGIWRKIRKRSGSATIMLGAMHDILHEDMQRAAEVIVEREAGKKMEEEESGEGDERDEQEHGGTVRGQ
jgi:hypothetical protein